LLFWAVLSRASLLPLSALPSDPDLPQLNSPNELARLREISARLSEINETLRQELSGSKQNSAALSNMLETSRIELEALKEELSPLREHSAGLLSAAAQSERELSGLRTALRKAESSLTSLEYSWESYRTEAEQRIARLEQGRRWYIGLIIGALAAAAGGWTAFAVTR
jgi:chromosome segregation ATPase